MTQKARKQIREAIASLLVKEGWKLDKYNNYKKTVNEKQYRYAFEDNVLRYELKVVDRWIRILSGFWKDLTITEGGKIVGWKRN
jgi:hypothetical protein